MIFLQKADAVRVQAHMFVMLITWSRFRWDF